LQKYSKFGWINYTSSVLLVSCVIYRTTRPISANIVFGSNLTHIPYCNGDAANIFRFRKLGMETTSYANGDDKS